MKGRRPRPSSFILPVQPFLSLVPLADVREVVLLPLPTRPDRLRRLALLPERVHRDHLVPPGVLARVLVEELGRRDRLRRQPDDVVLFVPAVMAVDEVAFDPRLPVGLPPQARVRLALLL